MVLKYLSALRGAQLEENYDAHLDDSDREVHSDEEISSPRLKEEELRALFLATFVEMERDLPKRGKKQVLAKAA